MSTPRSPRMGDQPCDKFTQNAWRRELCANCMKPRASHGNPTPTHRAAKKGSEVSSVKSVSKVTTTTTASSKGQTAVFKTERVTTTQTRKVEKETGKTKRQMSASFSDDILKLYDQAASQVEVVKDFEDGLGSLDPDEKDTKSSKFAVSKNSSKTDKPPTASVKPICRSQDTDSSTEYKVPVEGSPYKVPTDPKPVSKASPENGFDFGVKPYKVVDVTSGAPGPKIPLTSAVSKLNGTSPGDAASDLGGPTAMDSPATQRKKSFLAGLFGSSDSSAPSSPKLEKSDSSRQSKKKAKERKGSKDSGNGSAYEPVLVANESETTSLCADINKSRERLHSDTMSTRSADDLDSDLGDGNFSRGSTGRKSGSSGGFEPRKSLLSRIVNRRGTDNSDAEGVASSPAPTKKKCKSAENILDDDFDKDKDKKGKKGKSFFKRLFGKESPEDGPDQSGDDLDEKGSLDEKKGKRNSTEKRSSKEGSPVPSITSEKHEKEGSEKSDSEISPLHKHGYESGSMTMTSDLKDMFLKKYDRKINKPISATSVLDNKAVDKPGASSAKEPSDAKVFTFNILPAKPQSSTEVAKTDLVRKTSGEKIVKTEVSQKPSIGAKPDIKQKPKVVGRPSIIPPAPPPVSPKDSSESSGSASSTLSSKHSFRSTLSSKDDSASPVPKDSPSKLMTTSLTSMKPTITSPKPIISKPKPDIGLVERASIISLVKTDSSEEDLGTNTSRPTSNSTVGDSDSQKSPSHDGWKPRPKTDGTTKAGKVVRRMSAAPPPPPTEGARRRSTIEPSVTQPSGSTRTMQGVSMSHRLPGDFATLGRAGRVNRTTSVDVTSPLSSVKFARQHSDGPSNGLKTSVDDEAGYRKYKDPNKNVRNRNRTLTEGIKLDLNGLENEARVSKFMDRALPAVPKQDDIETLAENPYEMVSPDREKPSTPYEDVDDSVYQDLPDTGPVPSSNRGGAALLGVSPNSDYLEPVVNTSGEAVNKRDSRADLPPPPPPPASASGAKPKAAASTGAGTNRPSRPGGAVKDKQDDWRPRALPRRRPSNREASRPLGEVDMSVYANCDAVFEREKPALGLQEGFRKMAIINMECLQQLMSTLASEYITENPKQKDNLKWKDFNVYTKDPLYNHGGVVLYSAQSKSDFRDCVVMISNKPIGTDLVNFKHLNVLNPAVVFYDKISSEVFPDSAGSSKADPHPYQLYGMMSTQVVVMNCSRMTSLEDHMSTLSLLLTKDEEKYERTICHTLSQILNGMLYLIEKGFQIRTLTLKDILVVTPIGKQETFIAVNSVIYYRTVRQDTKMTSLAIVKLLFDLLQIRVKVEDKTAYRSIPVRSKYSIGFQKMVKTLQGQDKQSILSARNILEFMLWGPKDEVIKALTLAEDREQAFDVWLELERCRLVAKYATEEPEASLDELCCMKFLCSCTGAALFETTKILTVH